MSHVWSPRQLGAHNAHAGIRWCDFARERHECTVDDPECRSRSNTCRWFKPGDPVAVIFSDRLMKTGMVTMTSLCRHPTPLNVLVLMRVTDNYQPVPESYLSCRVLSMTLSDSLKYLRSTGWMPDRVCDGPGSDALGRVTVRCRTRASPTPNVLSLI